MQRYIKIKDSESLIKDLHSIYDFKKRQIFQFTLTVLICVQTFMAWLKELQKLIKNTHLNHPINPSFMILIRYCFLEHEK